MSTIYNSTPSVGKTEDVFSEQELERELEETQGEEPTEKMTDQDGENGGSGQGDGEPGMAANATGGVEGSEEQETIPSSFFSAMAYSIEAYLSAIDAQQEAALMNIDLYVDQVHQQQETTGSLAKTVRQKIRHEAQKMMVEAYTSFATVTISIGQGWNTGRVQNNYAKDLGPARTARTNLELNRNNMSPPIIAATRSADPNVTVKNCPDRVGFALKDAEVSPANGSVGADQKYGLDPVEYKEYSARIENRINAVDHKISGLQSDMQSSITYWQVWGEAAKSLIQGGGAAWKGSIDMEISELEFDRTYLENCKDLMSSLIQQIQGRISSSSKGSLDGIDTLRNAIRQLLSLIHI